MPSYGIINKSLNWFVSCFENRTQMVTVNGTLGDKKQIKYGLPQGSILGLVLFVLCAV